MGSSSQYINDEENWHVSTRAHKLWLVTGSTMVLISLAKSILLTRTWLEPTLAALSAYFLVDLVSGIYHWAIDNYGNAKTWVFGSQIESFQSHHHQPWAITKRHLANNVYVPAVVTTALVFPVIVFFDDPVLLSFAGVFMGWGMFIQQFHAWAHTQKRKLPGIVVGLQYAGIIVGRGQHGAHHQPPYDDNYCIVSGVWNRFLDWSRFFWVLEMVVFKVFGVRPRSWGNPGELISSQG